MNGLNDNAGDDLKERERERIINIQQREEETVAQQC